VVSLTPTAVFSVFFRMFRNVAKFPSSGNSMKPILLYPLGATDIQSTLWAPQCSLPRTDDGESGQILERFIAKT
jgi:hypothetical protein